MQNSDIAKNYRFLAILLGAMIAGCCLNSPGGLNLSERCLLI